MGEGGEASAAQLSKFKGREIWKQGFKHVV